MKKFLISFGLMLMSLHGIAQIDSTLLKRIPKDTSSLLMNMDAVYNRPFLRAGKLPVSLGGYVEANFQHRP